MPFCSVWPNTLTMSIRRFSQNLFDVKPKSQAGCRFEFDFSKVYYNPRLATEHAKLVSTYLHPRVVLLDAFAGVGPFAIQAARNLQCFVMASDLNPCAVDALNRNVHLNRLAPRVRVSAGDARDRIRSGVLELWRDPFIDPPPIRQRRHETRDKSGVLRPEASMLAAKPNSPCQLVGHFVMNLPELALSFLDAFVGVYEPLLREFGQIFEDVLASAALPMVHCYCFTKAGEGEKAERDICNVRLPRPFLSVGLIEDNAIDVGG